MADIISSLAPWSHSVANTFGKIRQRGSATVMAALGAPSERPILPPLQGKALAKHHLNLALAALHENGMSKPSRFRKLRLLINTMEQGHQLPVPATTVVPPPPMATLSRRARLISRAKGSTLFASLRPKTTEESQPTHYV